MKFTLETKRIAKRIAESGLCSRREAEELIKKGKVNLNGNLIQDCNINVNNYDKIKVNGHEIKKKEKIRIWLYYKKKGFLVTTKDKQKRPNIFDEIKHKIGKRLISVGRLDFNSEGLLLLTNNGDFARKLELPKNNFKRTYRVRIFGTLNNEIENVLKNGIVIDGIKYKSIDVFTENQKGKNMWLTMTLKEGKNREIRKIMNFFGCSVNRLIRVSYGPFNLNSLKPGEIKEFKKNNFIKKLNLSN